MRILAQLAEVQAPVGLPVAASSTNLNLSLTGMCTGLMGPSIYAECCAGHSYPTVAVGFGGGQP